MSARYPSPSHNAGHPFYDGYEHLGGVSAHHGAGPAHHDGGADDGADDDDDDDDEDEEGEGEDDSDAPHQDPSHGVPDDPQLRANLERMISGNFAAGSFNSFDLLQSHNAGHAASQHLPQGSAAFAQTTGSPDSAAPDSAAPAAARDKAARTKVSRACDECRRKKIRCDALDETAATPCTSCARTGLKCAFSRQPLKRGPSKGYIKELAERLQHLEQAVQDPTVASHQQAEIRRVQAALAAEGGQQFYAPGVTPVEPRAGDKRSYAVAEGWAAHGGAWDGIVSSPQQLQMQMQMQSQQQLHHLPQSPQLSRVPQPFWRVAPNTTAQDNTSVPYDHANAESISVTGIGAFDWDEDVIGEYYRLIHQTFPLLPNSKTRLRHKLRECPASLREAFLAAIDCLMRTFPTSTLTPSPSYPLILKRAAENLAKYPFDNPSAHTPATNLVYLQTLLLMAIETDNHGPATIRGQAGPSRAEWLGRAAGVAGQLEINTIRSDTAGGSILSGDRDSEDRLARRVWWVLFILDRWHASSTADLLKLPENSVVLLPEDQILLGESTYHLARLSFIIGHLAAILTTTKTPSTDVMAPSNPASSLLTLTLAGEIDRFRESVESVWGSLNLVHLSYHHVHLLIKRLNPLTEPPELVGHAVKVATVLNSRATPVTPLNHHFAALSAMTLCELADVSKTRDQAIKGLEELRSCLGGGRGLAGFEGSEGWDGAIRELVVAKLERIERGGGGAADGEALRSLAEAAVGAGTGGAAVGVNGGDGEGGPFDPTMLTRYGYLSALAQRIFRTK